MQQSPLITPFQYYAPRVAGVVAVLALALLIQPASAFFSSLGDESEVVRATTGGYPDPASALASASSSGLDEALPTGGSFPAVSLTAAVAKELGSPTALFSYRTNARWPLASVTKLMTSVVALETLGPATILTIPQSAIDTEGVSGGMKAGERYAVIDLVRMMLTVSSNDAAIAVAQAYDKRELGEAAYEQTLNKTALFTAAMQEKARLLGMSETYFGDPSGLSVINQSVVRDLEVLMQYIQNTHPILLEVSRATTNKVLERKTMTSRSLTNINTRFAGTPEFVGGKTGFIDESSGNLLSLFKYNGKQYLIIVLGAEDREGETAKIFEWVKEQVAP
jgi:D-alanyl-D-alanine carboxypeptidase